MTTDNAIAAALTIVTVLFFGFTGFGYINNLVKFCHLDFNAPYKAEVIRSVGVIVPPVGVIVGYVSISDKAE